MEDVQTTRRLLGHILNEVALSDGSAALDRFASLRDVDAKVREVRMILKPISGAIGSLYGEFDADPDFQANSRRVRLEALANYCRSAIRFLDHGGGTFEKVVAPCPSITKLTRSVPALETILRARWMEAQGCQNAGASLAAVVMLPLKKGREHASARRVEADPPCRRRGRTGVAQDGSGQVQPRSPRIAERGSSLGAHGERG